jgi:urease accessory protein
MGTIMTTVTTIMVMTTSTIITRTAKLAIMTMIMSTDTTAATHIVMARSNGTPPRPPVHASPAAGAAPALALEYAALYRLMTWLSPSFPVGAFSYSSGIEWAVEAGDISDAASLRAWLSTLLSDGAGFCDGVFLCHAWRAAAATDDDALATVAELAAAFTPSRERRLETTAQGRAFADIAAASWTCDTLTRLMRVASGPIAYPVAVGAVAAGHGVRLEWSLHAFLHAQIANWISAGVRLIPLGQTDSQRVMAALEPIVALTATRALQANLDDIASATFRADLASMRHETQYTRLFRT